MLPSRFGAGIGGVGPPRRGRGRAGVRPVTGFLKTGRERKRRPFLLSFPRQPMLLADRIARAETRIFKAVFPNTTNHYDTLFGGTTLLLMDEVAFIAATRFSRLKMVTVSSERVDFTHPIPGGSLVELVANIEHVGRTSLKVCVELFVEQMYSEERHKAVTGLFTFVAVDEHKQPVRILAEETPPLPTPVAPALAS
jgi:acyl-CoA hydrolase